jgi:hypothetical protein
MEALVSLIFGFLNNPPSSSLLSYPVMVCLLAAGIVLFFRERHLQVSRWPSLVPFLGYVCLLFVVEGRINATAALVFGVMAALFSAASVALFVQAIWQQFPTTAFATVIAALAVGSTYAADLFIPNPNYAAFGWIAVGLSAIGILVYLVHDADHATNDYGRMIGGVFRGLSPRRAR